MGDRYVIFGNSTNVEKELYEKMGGFLPSLTVKLKILRYKIYFV
jgi:transposase